MGFNVVVDGVAHGFNVWQDEYVGVAFGAGYEFLFWQLLKFSHFVFLTSLCSVLLLPTKYSGQATRKQITATGAKSKNAKILRRKLSSPPMVSSDRVTVIACKLATGKPDMLN